jgi:hypothetical protein
MIEGVKYGRVSMSVLINLIILLFILNSIIYFYLI